MGARPAKYTLNEMTALRDEAGQASLERIDADLRHASWKIRPHLRKIRKHLFNRDFQVSELLESRGAGPGLTVDFHREMGESLGDYVDKERVATAARLICRAPDLNLDDGAFLVGFRRRSVLSNAFERHAGMRPTVFRDKWTEAVGTAGPPRIEVHSLQLLKELREGRLSAVKARQLLDFFDALERSRPVLPPLTPPASARELAEEAWERIAAREPEQQLLWVRDVLRFNRSAFFLLLGEKIEAEIAGDGNAESLRRAFWYTLLAMVHVQANAHEVGEDETRTLRPLALEWLDGVRRRAEVSGLEERVLSETSRLRLQDLEARLLQGVGQLDEAEKRFRETRLGFLRQFRTADAAVVSLGLGILLLERGDMGPEVPALASESIPVLQAHPDRTDAAAALSDLSEAIRCGGLTAEILRETRNCLARICPGLLESRQLQTPSESG